MRCPVCSYENPANARFCNQCGTDLSLMEAHDAEPSFYDRIHDRDRYSTANVTQTFDAVDPTLTQTFATSDPEANTVPLDGNPTVPYAASSAYYASQTAHESQGAYYALDDEQEGQRGRLPSLPAFGSRKARLIAVLAAIGLCALVAIVAIVTYTLQLWGGREVPEVAGMTQQAAVKQLENDGFSVSTEDERSDEVQGTVLSCDPQPGLRVEPGTHVTLKIAVSRKIPDIVGKTQEEARALLEEEGLANVTYDYLRSDDAEDTVLSVAPDAGSSVLSTTSVTVVVAQPYTVPDVVGRMQDDATKLVEEAGFVATVARVNDEEAEEGLVLSTDPAAGERASSGSTVTISVAHHRSSEAIELTRKFLTDSEQMTINGQTCVIDEVKSITYAGDNTCDFTIVMRPYETHTWMFGWGTETRYGNPETVTGKITWNDSDNVVSTEPSMKQGA